jgi:hypothetical protein
MKSIIILIALHCFANINPTFSQEYTIYDSNYKPKAYLFQTENDILIYSFDGKPLGFLDQEESEDFVIYGHNGKHLGWLSDGWIYDKSGMIVGFLEGATKMKRVKIPRKEERQRFIFSSLKEIADLRPAFHHKWSKTRLEDFLNSGLIPDEFQQLLKRPAQDKPKIISI